MKKLVFFFLSLAIATASFSELSAQAAGANPTLVMYRYNSSSSISPLPILNSDTLGTLHWKGLVNYKDIRTGASILSYVTDPVGANLPLQANMLFRTSGPLGLTDRMIITEEGRVGINTNTPSNTPDLDFRLHVVGNTHTTGDFFGRIHFDQTSLNGQNVVNNVINNFPPNEYDDEAYFELKNRAQLVSVLPGPIQDIPSGTNAQGGLLSLAPGGTSLDHQLFFGDEGIFTRRKAGNANDWNNANWYKLMTSESINGHVGRLPRFNGATLGAPSSTLNDSQIFDDGVDNVVIGENDPPTPPASFNTSYRLTVNGLPLPNGAAYINGNTFINNGNLGIGKAPTDFDLDVAGESNFDGRVKIGATAFPTFAGAAAYELVVGGGILAEEVLVRLQSSWADYVFEKGYELHPLSEVEAFIQQEKHLPGIASAKEVAENGLNLGEMQKAQMEKIEEIYLHLIALEKRVNALEAQNRQLEVENAALKANNKN